MPGFTTESWFAPLDSVIFIRQTEAQPLPNDFEDGRSIVAKRHRHAQEAKDIFRSSYEPIITQVQNIIIR